MKKSSIMIAMLSVLVITLVSCKKKTDYSLLDKWKGTYTVTAESYYGDSKEPPVTTFDETWTVNVTKVEGSETKLAFSGIGDANSLVVYATLDPEALTISFESGQSLGVLSTVDDSVYIYYATDDFITNNASNVSQDMVNEAAGYELKGTLSNDGGIVIDRFAEYVGPAAYVWDVFKTTWVKQ